MALRFRIRPPGRIEQAVERIVDVELTNGLVTVGRAAGSNIELPFGAVSALHAQIRGRDLGWELVDLNSANGTFVDQGVRRLASGEAYPLRPGEQVRLADVWIIFEGPVAPGAGPAESTNTLARRLVADFFGRSGAVEVARVIVERGSDAGRTLELTVVGQTYRLGQGPNCDLVMTDEGVAREHVAFERHWHGVEVRDLGTRSGVFLDSERVGGWRRIYDGDVVTLGESRLRLDDPEDRYLRQMQSFDGESPSSSAKEPTIVASVGTPPSVPGMITLPVRRAPMVIAVLAGVVLAVVAGCAIWLLIGA